MDTLERTRLRDPLPGKRSLVEQAREVFRHGNAPEQDNPAPPEVSAYPDGYIRVSPPQPYRTPEGYYRNLALKAALYGAFVVLLLILAVALVRSGILRGILRF